MRRILGSLTAALALITVAVLGATPAQAATITIDYELDGTESTWTRPSGTDIPCTMQSGGTYFYRVQALTVDVDGDYLFRDSGYLDLGLNDGFIAIYSAFDPASPLSDCLAAIDDNPNDLPVTLAAGTTYILVQSSLSSTTNTGTYQFSASGPGTATVSSFPADTTTSVTAAPNPATVGDEVTLTATVTGLNPSGEVEFFADGVSLGTAPLVDGSATLPVSSLAEGTYEITAAYPGDSFNPPSSTEVPAELVINPAPVTPVVPTPPQRIETAAA